MAKDVQVLIANNAVGELGAALGSAATSLQLKAGQGAKFPSPAGGTYFYVTIVKDTGDWEIVKVTAKSSDQFTTIVRNIESSTGSAQSFAIDDKVALRVCKQVFNDMITEIEKTELIAPSGTKMYFYQNVAPTGWTIDGAVADALLAVKGGANAYNVAGGGLAGTWTQPNHVHDLASHVHATNNHVLLVSEMPSHDHTDTSGAGHNHDAADIQLDLTTGYGSVHVSGAKNSNNHSHGIPNQGGGNGHNHGDTNGPSGSTDTLGSATAATYRPYGAVGIIATKD